MTKYASTALTIIIVPLTLSHLCLVLLVRLGVYFNSEFVRIFFFTNRFFTTAVVRIPDYRGAVFCSQVKSTLSNLSSINLVAIAV